jgi:DNA-binding NtrC family response regulator
MTNAGRILIIDHDKTSRSALEEYLTNCGYKVVAACDEEDSLKKFAPGKFDCVISDLFMPTIDGLELLKKIKRRDSDVSCLTVTGHPKIDSAMSAIKEGDFDYIAKPFKRDDIQMKVEQALHLKKTAAALRKGKTLSVSLVVLMPIVVSLGVILGILWKGI